MRQSKRLKICILPDGHGRVRNLALPTWLLPVVTITTLVLIGGLSIFAYHSHNALAKFNTQARDLEALRNKNASLEQQLIVFTERIDSLGSKLEDLAGYEKDLTETAEVFREDLGMPQEAEVDDIIPVLTRATAWANGAGRNGVGGGQPRGAAGLLGVDQMSRETIQGMHRDLDKLMLATDEAAEFMIGLKDNMEATSSILASTPMYLPLQGRMSSTFGYRTSPFGGRSGEVHKGLDIPAPIGTPIKVPADGTVISSDRTGSGYGLMVTVDHGYGLVTRYAHLSASKVEAGDEVKRGQIIAEVGNSGRSTGPHLHYETLLAGVSIDPLKLTVSTMAARNKSPSAQE